MRPEYRVHLSRLSLLRSLEESRALSMSLSLSLPLSRSRPRSLSRSLSRPLSLPRSLSRPGLRSERLSLSLHCKSFHNQSSSRDRDAEVLAAVPQAVDILMQIQMTASVLAAVNRGLGGCSEVSVVEWYLLRSLLRSLGMVWPAEFWVGYCLGSAAGSGLPASVPTAVAAPWLMFLCSVWSSRTSLSLSASKCLTCGTGGRVTSRSGA